MFILVGHWLGLSSYRALPRISVGQSLLVFLPSFVVALAAFVLAPDLTPNGESDLKEHHFRVAAWVFPLLAIFVVLAGLADRVVLGEDIFPLWTYVARAGILITPAFTQREWVHWAALSLSLVATALLASVYAA